MRFEGRTDEYSNEEKKTSFLDLPDAKPEEFTKHDGKKRLVEFSEMKEQLAKRIFKKQGSLKRELNKLCDVILAIKREEDPVKKRRIWPLRDILLDKTRHKLNNLQKMMALLENEYLDDAQFRDLGEHMRNVDLYLGIISSESPSFFIKKGSEADKNKRYSHLLKRNNRQKY